MSVTDGFEELEELKTISYEHDFTKFYEFEETTEFFDFEQIKTDFNLQFEEIID